MAGKGRIENLKPFEKGNKLSKGRPKGFVSLKDRLAKSLEIVPNFSIRDAKGDKKKNTRKYVDMFIERVFGIILRGDDKVALDAIKFLTETIDGKPTQRSEIEGSASFNLKDINFSTMTDDQLGKVIDRLNGDS